MDAFDRLVGASGREVCYTFSHIVVLSMSSVVVEESRCEEALAEVPDPSFAFVTGDFAMAFGQPKSRGKRSTGSASSSL